MISKYAWRRKKIPKKLISKCVWRKSQKNQSKNYCNIVLKILKENNELKSAEVDLVPSFIKDKRESFSDADVYGDDGSEEHKVVEYRYTISDRLCVWIATKY